MEDPGSPEKALTFEQLAALREQTEVISQFLHHQLTVHLEALRPLLAPRRLLGKYVGAKETVVGAEKAVAQLNHYYYLPGTLGAHLQLGLYSGSSATSSGGESGTATR
jgi:hypothetical protein